MDHSFGPDTATSDVHKRIGRKPKSTLPEDESAHKFPNRAYRERKAQYVQSLEHEVDSLCAQAAENQQLHQ
ncbi:hypothetical protein HDU98_001733 [Podochytrium sp. JEL0797]|nr:hypothetical protein HDU98_001733 [Podochytrium sp. JEL0797]